MAGIINSSNNLEETDRNAVSLATGLGWVCTNIFWGVAKTLIYGLHMSQVTIILRKTKKYVINNIKQNVLNMCFVT